MRPRAAAAAVLFAAALAGNAWEVVSWQPLRPAVPPSPGDRRDLLCFAELVTARTERGATVRFVLPPDKADGGLINHRLRYIVLGRHVETNLDRFTPAGKPDFIATWQGGCRGTVVRAK